MSLLNKDEVIQKINDHFLNTSIEQIKKNLINSGYDKYVHYESVYISPSCKKSPFSYKFEENVNKSSQAREGYITFDLQYSIYWEGVWEENKMESMLETQSSFEYDLAA